MTHWKRAFLSLYYHFSSPIRAHARLRLQASKQAPFIVLFYHRVANDGVNPWTISYAAFEREMRWLRGAVELVSLAEGQRRINSGQNDRICATVTFDDGYADNCHMALPLLMELEIPCTYFVTTKNVLSQRPFPHDVKHGHPLAPNTPQQIREMSDAGVDIGAHTRTHADLARIVDPQALNDELYVPQQELQEITGRPVRYFAFPYGQHENLSPAAFDFAREIYDGACSAYGGYNFPGDDPFHLQRIAVDDELIRLKNWVMLDQRKLRDSRRNRYELPSPSTTLVESEEVVEVDLVGVDS